jgi:hypothetical protein
LPSPRPIVVRKRQNRSSRCYPCNSLDDELIGAASGQRPAQRRPSGRSEEEVNAHTLSIAYRATGLAALFVLSLAVTRVYALAVLAPLLGRHGRGRAQGVIIAVRPRTAGSRYTFP